MHSGSFTNAVRVAAKKSREGHGRYGRCICNSSGSSYSMACAAQAMQAQQESVLTIETNSNCSN